jgi:hypothetical protein
MRGQEQAERFEAAPGGEGQARLLNDGAKAGAPSGPAHGRYAHGLQTRVDKAARQEMRDLVRVARQLAALF